MAKITRPDVCGRKIQGKNGKILTIFHLAEGEEKHPVVINLHGIPGCEQNGDMVHALHDAGIDVITPHYSGCFGSEGEYRLQHNIEDANTILDFVLENQEFEFDKDKIFAVGHSMGGFTCGNFAAMRKEIQGAILIMPCDIGNINAIKEEHPEANDIICQVLKESCNLIDGVTFEDFVAEISENAYKWKFETHAEALSKKPLLIIEGTEDTITPPKAHTKPLIEALKKEDDSKLVVKAFNTDHFIFNSRPEVIGAVKDFLLEKI